MALQPLEKIDLASDEQEKLMNYFYEHIVEFYPDDEEVDFIESRLKLNSKRKVKFGGFFYIVLINMIISLFGTLSIFVGGIFGLNTLGVTIYTSLLVLQIFTVITLFQRKKIAKLLIICTYVMFTVIIVLVAESFTGELIGELIRNSVYILYMFLSKRVKYTFVE